MSAIFAGGTAMASTPAPSDGTAAAKVAAQPEVKQRLASFFVHLDQHQQGKLTDQAVSEAAGAAKAPQVEATARPVYSLNPAFVKSEANAPVATFAYMAVGADSASGQHASVWLTKAGKSWTVMNIISGADEAYYPSRAAGGTVFTEPQIHAWYRLANGRVTGLNDTALTSVGKGGVTVAAYQRLVHTRYADKLPGSPYAKSGRLGGYSPSTGVHGRRPDGGSPVLLALGTGGALVGAAGVAVAMRRRWRVPS
ncbi:hypothetical protein J4573_27945 [Actinomadura barringtoniae]|uniref:Uncharacterized protein n=1 Tax=Actinomadura barringtoniae TaxID=1427535 RepID=A0A939PJI1_9ACTN|nr:hypothetical protein [Actinomadura barringtoniae]MBO2450959.1 hypothetical protein [Actinomadura barringtoniae]